MINCVGKQSIQTKEYVGYIILPHHIISIAPKIPQISFINMLKYAISLGKVIPDYFDYVIIEYYLEWSLILLEYPRPPFITIIGNIHRSMTNVIRNN